MSTFNAKAKRRPDGNYDLEFGKGNNKLTALMRVREDKMWQVTDGDGASVAGHKLKRDCMAAWGHWAEANYAGTNGGISAKARTILAPPPPTFKLSGGAPPFKSAGGPPSFKKPVSAWGIWCLMNGGDWMTDSPHQEHNICRFPTQADANKWIKNHVVAKNNYEARPIPTGKIEIVPDAARGDNQYLSDPFSADMVDKEGHLTPIGALDEVFSFLIEAEADLSEAPWVGVVRTLNRYLPTAAQYQVDTTAAS